VEQKRTEAWSLTGGNSRRTRYATIGLANCFDGEFPESVRRMRLAGAEVLLWCNAGTGSAKLGSSHRLHHSASYAQANLMWVVGRSHRGQSVRGISSTGGLAVRPPFC
jgi:predicted amidohydrolase